MKFDYRSALPELVGGHGGLSTQRWLYLRFGGEDFVGFVVNIYDLDLLKGLLGNLEESSGIIEYYRED